MENYGKLHVIHDKLIRAHHKRIHRTSSHIITYHYISSWYIIMIYHHISSYIIIYHQLIIYHHISYHQLFTLYIWLHMQVCTQLQSHPTASEASFQLLAAPLRGHEDDGSNRTSPAPWRHGKWSVYRQFNQLNMTNHGDCPKLYIYIYIIDYHRV